MNNSRCWSDTLPLSMQVLVACTNFTVKVVETGKKTVETGFSEQAELKLHQFCTAKQAGCLKLRTSLRKDERRSWDWLGQQGSIKTSPVFNGDRQSAVANLSLV